jgi:4-hydroxy-2-oxoheptanedioate aldolase
MLKTRLANGQRSLVVNVDFPSSGLVEAVGRLGADAVFFDCEQGPIGIESLPDLARAARLAGTASLIRVYSPQDWVLERYMATGADGVVVPRLNTPESAQSIVDNVRYIFPKTFNQKVIVVQIETAQALERLDDFLAIDGIDCFFVGPVDLSKSLGYDGDYKIPVVAEKVASTLTQIRSRNKSAGMLVKRDDISEIVKQGANFIYLHANDFLAVGMDFFRSKIKEQD